MEVKPVTA